MGVLTGEPFVIKCVKREDGPKIIEYFKSIGVDTIDLTGSCSQERGDHYIYYGVHRGKFNNWHLNVIKSTHKIYTIDEVLGSGMGKSKIWEF